MPSGSDLTNSTVALATIVCSYVFTAVAVLSVLIHIVHTLKKFGRFHVDDYLIVSAFILALALVAQITWAVIDEGQGQHLSNVARSQLNIMAKVF
jgi:hypothetical protein